MAKKGLKERLAERRQKLNEKGGNSHFHYTKVGDTRIRIVGNPDEDWARELVTFYVGKSTVISPATNGEPCALMQFHEKMKNSSNAKNKKFAEMLRPKKKWVVAALKYADSKGAEPDANGVRLVLLTNDIYGELIDLFVDDDEAGDFTDPINGYDIKIKRTGQGKQDTKYSLLQCKPTKLPKEFRSGNNLDDMIAAATSTFEQTEELLSKFLSGSNDEEEEQEAPKKKKKKRSDA